MYVLEREKRMLINTLKRANDLAGKIKEIQDEIGYMNEEFLAMTIAVEGGRYLAFNNIDHETWEGLKLIILTSLKDKLAELEDEFEKL